MKLVALWLAVALAVAGSCSINHRSSDFTCETQADCSTNRVCTDGFCVSTLPADAGVPRDAAVVCPALCTSCDFGANTCTIDCAIAGDVCTRPITCPAGWNCNLACSTRNACSSGVTCPANTACTITCTGAQSCRDIACGNGKCNVDCTGLGSCREIDCGTSCACDVGCHTGAQCVDVTCKSASCFASGPLGGCTSQAVGCNTCP